MSENNNPAPKCPMALPVRAERHFSQDISYLIDANGELFASVSNDRRSDQWGAFIAHAINSHATLTAEVARLREALEAILHHTTERFAREQARRALGGGA